MEQISCKMTPELPETSGTYLTVVKIYMIGDGCVLRQRTAEFNAESKRWNVHANLFEQAVIGEVLAWSEIPQMRRDKGGQR